MGGVVGAALLLGEPMTAGAALVFWCLVVFGSTAVVTTSKIAAPLRRAVPRAPLACPQCVGFWVGAGLALVPRAGLAWWASSAPSWCCVWLDAFAASGLCWAAHVVLVRLGARDL